MRARALGPDEIRRFHRHILLPGVGLAGQERLKGASVLVVGAGGLGCPVALYLAAAGVGRIGLVDDDVVDETNLHRQVLYGDADVGRPKVETAAARLREANAQVEVEPHGERLTRRNARALVAECDVVVDASDNFPTRYLVNDATVLEGRPNVHGSVFRFDGQVSVFAATERRDGVVERTGAPCYRCLHRAPPPAELVPSCAEGGVLGVVPGVVGALQASETLKILLGVGSPLVGRVLLVDALATEFTELRLGRDPSCVACGGPGLADLPEAFPDASCATSAGLEVEADAVASGEGPGLVVDVREPDEVEAAPIHGATSIPLGSLLARASEIPLDRDVLLVCETGARSARGALLLRRLGHGRVRSLAGGRRSLPRGGFPAQTTQP